MVARVDDRLRLEVAQCVVNERYHLGTEWCCVHWSAFGRRSHRRGAHFGDGLMHVREEGAAVRLLEVRDGDQVGGDAA